MLIQAIIESLLLLSCPLYKATATTVTTASATTRSTKTVNHVYMCSDDRCDEQVMTVLLSSCFDKHNEDEGDDNKSSVEKRKISTTTTSTSAEKTVNDQRSRADKVKRSSKKRVRIDADTHHSINDDNNTTIPTISSPSPTQAQLTTPAKRLKYHTPSPTAPSSTTHAAITHMHTHGSHWSCPCCTLLNIMQHLSCQACGSIRPSPPPHPPALPITSTPTATTTTHNMTFPSTMSVPPLLYPTPSGSGVHHSHPHAVIDLVATDDSDNDDDDGTRKGEGDIHIHMEGIISEGHTFTATTTGTSTTTPCKGHDLIDLCDDDDDTTDNNKCIVTDILPYIHHLTHPLILNTMGHNSDPSYTLVGERDMYDDDYILLGLSPYEDYSDTTRKPLRRYDETTLCYIRTLNTLLPSPTTFNTTNNHTHSKTPNTTATNMTVVSTHTSHNNASGSSNTTTTSNNNGDMQHTSSPLVFEPVTAEIYGRRYNSNNNKGSTNGSNKNTGKSKFWGKHIYTHTY